MKNRIVIRCIAILFAIVVFASSSTNETRGNNIEKSVRKDLEKRWDKEMELIPQGLKVRNDDGILVDLTPEEKPPIESSRRASSHAIYYHLYTNKNPTEPYEISADKRFSIRDLKLSNINHRRHTFFVTHGWTSNGNSSSCILVRDELVKIRPANVIVVDWGSMSTWSYSWAVTHVAHVSAELTKMIKFLIEHAKLDPNEITLVGHSLGAHIMGIAGNAMNGTLSTIIGLDPAYPTYRFADAGARISDTDAQHVQIIHTNAGFLGYDPPIGTTDFFVNGGSQQPGCYLDPGGACSHSRAYMYYAESINSATGFYGQSCGSKDEFMDKNCTSPMYARMGGFKVDRRLRGSFYLWANYESPFAKGTSLF